MDHLGSFDSKKLVPAEKADLKLDKEQTGLNADDARLLANFIKESLGNRVNEVRVSKRLVGSPAVVVESDTYMTTSMRRVMKMMRRDEPGGPETKPDLEINPDHGMMVQLEKARHEDAELAGQIAEQVFDNALVAAGLMEDPRAMVGRINALLEKLLAKEAKSEG
jgi:molecular chaperone HtpG